MHVYDRHSLKAALRSQRQMGHLRKVPRVPAHLRYLDYTKQVSVHYLARLLKQVAAMSAAVSVKVLPALPNLVAQGRFVKVRQDTRELTVKQGSLVHITAFGPLFPGKVRKDAWDIVLTDLMRELKILILTYNDVLYGELDDVALEAERAEASTQSQVASSALNANQPTKQAPAGFIQQNLIRVQPEIGEPWLRPMMQQFVKTNTKLVGNASDAFINALEQRVAAGLQAGLRAEELAKQIAQDFIAIDGLETKKAISRAKLIARDQIASFRGNLDRERQTHLGITKFVWRTVGDERVRETHRERDGQTFEWSRSIQEQLSEKGLTSDPIDGPPGVPINCRCTAEPLFDNLFEGLPPI